MDATRSSVQARSLDAPRRRYTRDDEEFDLPPRWIGSRLHADLVLAEAIDDRLRLGGSSAREGGQ